MIRTLLVGSIVYVNAESENCFQVARLGEAASAATTLFIWENGFPVSWLLQMGFPKYQPDGDLSPSGGQTAATFRKVVWLGLPTQTGCWLSGRGPSSLDLDSEAGEREVKAAALPRCGGQMLYEWAKWGASVRTCAGARRRVGRRNKPQVIAPLD